MTNREGTIKRLKNSLKIMNRWCRTDSLDDPISCIEYAIEEAIMFLEHDVVNPVYVRNDEWNCPECGFVVGWTGFDCGAITERKYIYCPGCGKVVKWNGN